MALKTSNKNRKKLQQQKIEQTHKEQFVPTKILTRYYAIIFFILFVVLIIV